MSETPSPRTVFVSHAHADNELADRYVTALRKRELDIWYDRTNMQDGHFLSEQIATELEQRNGFVVLLTPASVASFWVRLEIQAYLDLLAHDPARMLLSVRVAECVVPTLLRAFKWVDAVSLGFEGAVDAMAVALGASAPTSHATEGVDELVKKGSALIDLGKYEETITLLMRATQLDPRRSGAWHHLGRAYPVVGRIEDALAADDRALALDENQAKFWLLKGSHLELLKRHEEALVATDRALALDPNYALAWSNKGYALRQLGRVAEADEADRRAKKLGYKLK